VIAEERLSRIVNMVNERGAVSVPELMEELGASESTVRRDLQKLDRMGRLNKVHGGATRLREKYVVTDQSFDRRQTLHMKEKQAIAGYAKTLIEPDDFVFIDGGTTTMCLVDAIEETRATYLTNSLPHAQRLLAKGCRTLLPGGEVKPATEVLVGSETVNAIRRYHFTVGFWGTNGAGLESGFTTPEFSEAAVKTISIEQTVRPYVLADPSKFDKISLVTFAEFSAATVVTSKLSEEDRSLRMSGNVIEAEER
jgi:DeoR family fructose operon transcriptional repressor